MNKRKRQEGFYRRWRQLAKARASKASKNGSDSKASKGKKDGSPDSNSSGSDNRSK